MQVRQPWTAEFNGNGAPRGPRPLPGVAWRAGRRWDLPGDGSSGEGGSHSGHYIARIRPQVWRACPRRVAACGIESIIFACKPCPGTSKPRRASVGQRTRHLANCLTSQQFWLQVGCLLTRRTARLALRGSGASGGTRAAPGQARAGAVRRAGRLVLTGAPLAVRRVLCACPSRCQWTATQFRFVRNI